MAETKQQVVTENKSLEEVNIPHIYYGTEAPSDSLGKDGDIYVRYSN